MAADNGRLAELVERALDVDAGSRTAFVDEVCGSDSELKAEVHRLLAIAAASADAFLEGGPDPTLPSPLPAGAIVDRYLIEALIGMGGMGAVYQAWDPKIDRRVAVKVMRDRHVSPAQHERFLAEVRALGSVRDERVVRVYDAGDHDGHPFFVTELLEGEDLGRSIAAGHCGDLARRLEIAIEAAEALRAVHAAGLAHRDVKPSNLFITTGGGVKLLDFGIARALGPSPLSRTLACGTPRYMAPEQVRGEAATRSTDVFAFGLLLFELIGGRPAYQGRALDVLERVLNEPVPLEDLAGLCPPAVIDIIRRATAKDPAERLADFDDVLRRLRAVRLGPSRKRVVAAGVAGLSVLAVASLLGIAWLRSGPAASTVTADAPAAMSSLATTLSLGLLVDGGQGVPGPVTSSSLTLGNADRFRIVITPSTPGHVYVFAAPVDGSSLHVLFPSPTSYAGSSRVGSDRPTSIPEASWFEFEPRAGRERVWVAWSRAPHEPFEDARRWANELDRGRIGDLAARARLQAALGGRAEDFRLEEDGRLVLASSADVMIGALEIEHR